MQSNLWELNWDREPIHVNKLYIHILDQGRKFTLDYDEQNHVARLTDIESGENIWIRCDKAGYLLGVTVNFDILALSSLGRPPVRRRGRRAAGA